SRPPRPPLCPYTTLFRSSSSTRSSTIVDAFCLLADAFALSSSKNCRSAGPPHGAAVLLRDSLVAGAAGAGASAPVAVGAETQSRSEEHTSELQSRETLVC